MTASKKSDDLLRDDARVLVWGSLLGMPLLLAIFFPLLLLGLVDSKHFWLGLIPIALFIYCAALTGVRLLARIRARGGHFVCSHCRYDLRGTVKASHGLCPECGNSVACPICGYELRGALEAHGKTCPECGQRFA